MKPIVYLTGAPATGKSTLSRNLKAAYPNLEVFSYSERLREHLAKKAGAAATSEEDIRRQSSKIVTPQDIDELDDELIRLVADTRDKNPLLIDSHAVTKESYGFRVTGFSTQRLLQLNPDCIVCLYASNETIRGRISRNSQGRPQVSEFEAAMHTHLQMGLAVQYGTLLGKPVYLIDSSMAESELTMTVATKTKLNQQ
jgi:adenylate kinase